MWKMASVALAGIAMLALPVVALAAGSPIAEPAFTAAPPTVSAEFSSDTVRLGSTVNLGFIIENPESNPIALTGVGFENILPAGLRVISNTATVCGGTRTVTKPSTIRLAGATIAAGSRCKFAVSVTGWVAGTDTTTTSAVVSDQTVPGNVASAAISVWQPPTVRLLLDPTASITLGGEATLWWGITNPSANTVPLSDIDVTIAYPAGLRLSGAGGLCSGTLTEHSGGLTIAGASLPIGGSCNCPLIFAPSRAGRYTYTLTATAAGGGYDNNTASVVLSVAAPAAPAAPTPRPTPRPIQTPTAAAESAGLPTAETSPGVADTEAPRATAASSAGAVAMVEAKPTASPAPPASAGAAAEASSPPLVLVMGASALAGAAICLAVVLLAVLKRRRRRTERP